VGVFLGKMVCPPTPTIGVCDGLVGPQNSISTEKVALVSRRRQMRCPSTKRLTLGSRNEMVVAGREVPRPHQSSVASPMRSGLERELGPALPLGVRTINHPMSMRMAPLARPGWRPRVWPGFGPMSLPPAFEIRTQGAFV
jgi:hypothetical protein